MRYAKLSNTRRGVIAPLTGVLMVFLVGMVAFGVDMGWIVLSQTNLQNAADAAALAGAQPLINGNIQYSLAQNKTTKATAITTATANAQAKAIQYASYNAAGAVKSLVLNSTDIQFGYMDANNNYTPQSQSANYPNTIRVLLRLDSTANGSLGLFFAPVLGSNSTSLTASAAATIYSYNLNNISTSGGSGSGGTFSSGMLPLTYDINNWTSFIQTGQSPDGNSYTDSSGNPIIQAYPSPTNNPGNFGQLSLNDSHVGASTEIGWVNNGPSASDIQALQNNGLIPLSQHNPNLANNASFNWQGDTGFKASLVMTINSYVGKTFVLPLFQPLAPAPSYQAASGQGANTYYNIVQFVSVTIVQSPSNNGQIWLQPSASILSNGVAASGSLVPAGATPSSGSGFLTNPAINTFFAPPKLTQ